MYVYMIPAYVAHKSIETRQQKSIIEENGFYLYSSSSQKKKTKKIGKYS